MPQYFEILDEQVSITDLADYGWLLIAENFGAADEVSFTMRFPGYIADALQVAEEVSMHLSYQDLLAEVLFPLEYLREDLNSSTWNGNAYEVLLDDRLSALDSFGPTNRMATIALEVATTGSRSKTRLNQQTLEAATTQPAGGIRVAMNAIDVLVGKMSHWLQCNEYLTLTDEAIAPFYRYEVLQDVLDAQDDGVVILRIHFSLAEIVAATDVAERLHRMNSAIQEYLFPQDKVAFGLGLPINDTLTAVDDVDALWPLIILDYLILGDDADSPVQRAINVFETLLVADASTIGKRLAEMLAETLEAQDDPEAQARWSPILRELLKLSDHAHDAGVTLREHLGLMDLSEASWEILLAESCTAQDATSAAVQYLGTILDSVLASDDSSLKRVLQETLDEALLAGDDIPLKSVYRMAVDERLRVYEHVELEVS